MSESLRSAAVQHCPYCADDDLWPVEQPTGGWQCRGCARVFTVTLSRVDTTRIPGRVAEDAALRGGTRS